MSNLVINPPEFSQIEKSKAEQIKDTFEPMVKMLQEFEGLYEEIVNEVSNGITKELTQKAKRVRIDIAKVRIATEKNRKAQKEEYLRAGKAIDGVANILKWAVSEKEDKLKEIEKHYENLEKERLEKLQADRVALLLPYDEDANLRDLSSMDKDVFDALLSTKRNQYEERLAAEAEAKAKEEARLRAEAEERERMRLENEKLKKEAEERAKKEAEERKERERIQNLKDLVSQFKSVFAFQALNCVSIASLKDVKGSLETFFKDRDWQEFFDQAKIEFELVGKLIVEKNGQLIEAEKVRVKKQAEEDARIEAEAKKELELKKGDSEKVQDLITDLKSLKSKYEFKSNSNQKMYSEVGQLIDKIVAHINSRNE